MPEKEGNDAEATQDTRKRRRTTRGSQTDDEPSKSENRIRPTKWWQRSQNSKLDLALAGIMEKENSDLRKSSEFSYKSIATLTERADTQQMTLSKLTEDVNKLTLMLRRNAL